MKYLATIGTALLALGAALPAAAEYPEKPVEFVVPWPPGDLEDILTRMIADEFQSTYGVPAAVVNKPGGGGGPFPGAAEVANAPADGYTIGSFVVSIPLSGPKVGIPALSPDPFDPIGVFLTYPFVIATSEDAPYSSMDEMASYAADNDIAFGHFGTFIVPTQVTMAYAKNKGFDFGSEAAFDMLDCNTLASGDVDVITTTLQLILPCIDDVKVLASIGADRIPLTPDTPTVAELDPTLDIALWNGLFVHEDTPDDVREKIAAVAKKVMESDAAKKISDQTGALIYWTPGDEAEAQIERDRATIEGVLSALEN